MNMSTRQYRMVARAESAERTADRILDAALDLFWADPTASLSLDDVAARAGLSVRTVIRRFGTKDALITAAAARSMERVSAARATPAGDIPAAVAVLVDHYETMGAGVLRMLAAEHTVQGLAALADQGRELHRAWCAGVFAAELSDAPDFRLAQLVAVCDVTTWATLRERERLSRAETEQALIDLLTSLLEVPR